MGNRKKLSIEISIFLILVLVGTIVYASYNTKKQINNSSKEKVKIAKFNYDNIRIADGSIASSDDIKVKDDQVSLNVKLNSKDEVFEFTIDVNNKDDNDLMLLDFYNLSLTKEELIKYDYSVTYNDGILIEKNDKLEENSSEKIRVKIKYKDDFDLNNIVENDTLRVGFSFQYVKDNGEGKEVLHKSFEPKVGDYVRYNVSKKEYKMDAKRTGNTSYIINPSELNLYRVIRINEDKTIDMVSVNCGSTDIIIEGLDAYLNYVDTLDNIASNYVDKKFVSKARIVGYNGQTKVIEDKSKIDSKTVLLRTSTIDNSNEKLGGGDILYKTDLELINNTFGSLYASKVSGEACSYFVSSRYYYYRSSSNYYYTVRMVNSSGKDDFKDIYSYYNRKYNNVGGTASIRPIVTVNSGLKGIYGDGSINRPYELVE